MPNKTSSKRENHCIIQWYDLDLKSGTIKQRDQTNFQNRNSGSQDLLPSYLSTSKSGHFKVKNGDLLSVNSYKIDVVKFRSKKIPRETTDLFLYGHSTYRDWDVKVGSVRGVSIGGHYVSSAKIADFLEHIAGSTFRSKDSKLRIWLLSCHTAEVDMTNVYAEWLARKLAEKGWRNKRFIAFESAVNTETLNKCRDIAQSHALYQPLNLGPVAEWKPRLISLSDEEVYVITNVQKYQSP
jgi:hypothetical protein